MSKLLIAALLLLALGAIGGHPLLSQRDLEIWHPATPTPTPPWRGITP